MAITTRSSMRVKNDFCLDLLPANAETDFDLTDIFLSPFSVASRTVCGDVPANQRRPQKKRRPALSLQLSLMRRHHIALVSRCAGLAHKADALAHSGATASDLIHGIPRKRILSNNYNCFLEKVNSKAKGCRLRQAFQGHPATRLQCVPPEAD